MSHFYGTLNGNRGEATRCGTVGSGLRTNAAGWGGCIQTSIYEEDDRDMYRVFLTPWQSSGGSSVMLACGLLKSVEIDDSEIKITPWAQELFDSWLPQVDNRKTLDWMMRKVAHAQSNFGEM